MKKKFLIVLLCIIFITSLSGCSLIDKAKNKLSSKTKINEKVDKKTKKKSSKTKEKKKEEQINLVGKYELIEMKSNDKSYSKEDIQSLKNIDLTVTVELKEDKTAVLDLFGSKQEFKYDNKYFYSNDDKISFTVENNKLKLIRDGEYLYFEKVQ